MAGWRDRLKASAFQQAPATGEQEWPGSGEGARALDAPAGTYPYTPEAISEAIVPGVKPAMQDARALSWNAGLAAGKAPMDAVATGYTPPPPDPAVAGPVPIAPPGDPQFISLGHSSRTQSTTTTSPDVPPAEAARSRQAMEASRSSEIDARAQLGLIQQERYKQEGNVVDWQRAQIRQREAVAEKELAANKERMAAQEQRNAEMLASIEPDFNFYRGKYGGLRMLGHAIAIGMGGMAQGMMAAANIRAGHPGTLGDNPVLRSIERAYELDMKQQLAEMSSRKWKYQQGRNMLADLRQQTGDIRQALALAKQAYLDEGGMQMKAIAARYGQAAAPLVQDIEDAALAPAREQARLAAIKAGTARQVKTESRSSGGSQQVDPRWAMQAQLWKAQQLQQMKGGGEGRALPAKVAEGLGALEGFASRLDKWGRDYLGEAAKPGHSIKATLGGMWGDKARVLEVQKGGLIAELRRAKESGVMTDKDFDRYVARVPTLLDSVETARAKVQALKSDLQLEYGGKLRGLRSGGFNVSGYPSILRGEQ